jgi:hypothetical protein
MGLPQQFLSSTENGTGGGVIQVFIIYSTLINESQQISHKGDRNFDTVKTFIGA